MPGHALAGGRNASNAGTKGFGRINRGLAGRAPVVDDWELPPAEPRRGHPGPDHARTGQVANASHPSDSRVPYAGHGLLDRICGSCCSAGTVQQPRRCASPGCVARLTSRRGPPHPSLFEVEQPAFRLDVGAPTANAAVGVDDPMAGHHRRERAARQRTADRASGSGPPDRHGHVAVAGGRPVQDGAHGAPHGRVERSRAAGVKGYPQVVQST